MEKRASDGFALESGTMRYKSMPEDNLDRMVKTNTAAGNDMEGVGCDDRRVLALEIFCNFAKGRLPDFIEIWGTPMTPR